MVCVLLRLVKIAPLLVQALVQVHTQDMVSVFSNPSALMDGMCSVETGEDSSSISSSFGASPHTRHGV